MKMERVSSIKTAANLMTPTAVLIEFLNTSTAINKTAATTNKMIAKILAAATLLLI